MALTAHMVLVRPVPVSGSLQEFDPELILDAEKPLSDGGVIPWQRNNDDGGMATIVNCCVQSVVNLEFPLTHRWVN
ncbi:MAG: hypothetical protein R2867_13400 [Caldilineaceae bacterium]